MGNRKMRLGVSTFLWDREELLPQIPLLGKEGIKLIEIWGIPLHFNYNDRGYVESAREELNKHID